jgi:hypothetical protein
VVVAWVSFGTAVPSRSSFLAVARHLPHGRSPGGDRHLNFYGNRDNLVRGSNFRETAMGSATPKAQIQ